MALTKVQSAQNSGHYAFDWTCAFATPPTIGNAIVVAMVWGADPGSAPATASDNYGNVYNAVVNNGGAGRVALYRCPYIAATGASFTVSVPGTGQWSYGGIIEVTGITAGLCLGVDQTKTATGTGTAVASGLTAALTGSNVFAVGMAGSGVGLTVETVSPPWVQEYEAGGAELDHRSLTGVSGTTQQINWTNASSAAWTVAFAVFKEIPQPPVDIRVSQLVPEVLTAIPGGSRDARVSAFVLEVISTVTGSGGGGSVGPFMGDGGSSNIWIE